MPSRSYTSLEWIALSNSGCVTSNVCKSRQETSKFVRVIRMFFTFSMLICVSFTCHNVIHQRDNSLGGSISSWQTQTELDHLEDMQMQRSGRTVCMVKTHKTAQVQFRTTQLSLLNRDKSGTPGQKRDKLASRKTSDFFRDLRLQIGTVPENRGRMVTLILLSLKLEGCRVICFWSSRHGHVELAAST